ncbi:MAG TPA: pantoate--beta-alanine ligase [Pseudacidobacterium sp.]|jgi:pantoate--beta-alanine ligase|nr:pantoate--beta-alanine ligase [Pseudacidobacterium sp.]
MLIFKSIHEAQSSCAQLRGEGRVLGLVPTMGALHEGHLSLVRAAKAECDVVAVSIFVNPAQFGPNEDFAKYPRTFEQDCMLLEREGVHIVFAPTVEEMYPTGASTFVLVEGVSERLDGTSRPGHFRGVTTVVSKLFHILCPHKAYFGQKDAAQVAVLRKMVRDLNCPVRLEVCPIVRETDGLAMSSRNRYLSPQERRQALVLGRALHRVEEVAAKGETSSQKLIEAARSIFAEESQVRIDYLAVVNPDTLEDVSDVRAGALVAVAAFVGTTRLIDNILLQSHK